MASRLGHSGRCYGDWRPALFQRGIKDTHAPIRSTRMAGDAFYRCPRLRAPVSPFPFWPDDGSLSISNRLWRLASPSGDHGRSNDDRIASRTERICDCDGWKVASWFRRKGLRSTVLGWPRGSRIWIIFRNPRLDRYTPLFLHPR